MDRMMRGTPTPEGSDGARTDGEAGDESEEEEMEGGWYGGMDMDEDEEESDDDDFMAS